MDEIPAHLKPIIEKARKQSDTFRKKILKRQLQKFVDKEVIEQNVRRKLTVRIVNSIPRAVAQAITMWNAIEVSWSDMQETYGKGKPVRANDPLYCWCLAWHEVAHFNVPNERNWSEEKGRYTRWKTHGPLWRKYCVERGHHPNVQADVELWRKKGVRLDVIHRKWSHDKSKEQDNAWYSGEHKNGPN